MSANACCISAPAGCWAMADRDTPNFISAPRSFRLSAGQLAAQQVDGRLHRAALGGVPVAADANLDGGVGAVFDARPIQKAPMGRPLRPAAGPVTPVVDRA